MWLLPFISSVIISRSNTLYTLSITDQIGIKNGGLRPKQRRIIIILLQSFSLPLMTFLLRIVLDLTFSFTISKSRPRQVCRWVLFDRSNQNILESILCISAPISLSQDMMASLEEKCGCKYKTDMCYERDRGVFAVGLSNG